MKVIHRAALAAALAGALAAPPRPALAAVSADVQKLPQRRAVQLADPGARRAVIEEDSLLAAASGPRFDDLRLMDSGGQVVPMGDEWLRRRDVTFVPQSSRPIRWSAGEDGSRQATFDLGSGDQPPLSLEVTGPAANGGIQVMGSADSVTWYILPQKYDGNEPRWKYDPSVTSFRVGLSEVQRWLRLVQDSGYPPPSADDQLTLYVRHDLWTPRVPVFPASMSAGYDAVTGSTWKALIEFDGPARAITRLDLEAADPARARYPIQVEARLERGGWQYLALEYSPDWTHGPRDSVVFEPIRTTALRITVEGADAPNAPFTIAGIQSTPQRWTFEPRPGESYWLGFGDRYLSPRVPAARAPERPADDEILAAPRARLGPPEPNPYFKAPGFGLEWLKRRPVVLSVAMVGILLLVALLARRPARS